MKVFCIIAMLVAIAAQQASATFKDDLNEYSTRCLLAGALKNKLSNMLGLGGGSSGNFNQQFYPQEIYQDPLYEYEYVYYDDQQFLNDQYYYGYPQEEYIIYMYVDEYGQPIYINERNLNNGRKLRAILPSERAYEELNKKNEVIRARRLQAEKIQQEPQRTAVKRVVVVRR